MTELRVGSKAPKFRLNDKDGVSHGIDSAEAPFTVLFFYPKDNTPGCTVEAQEFSAALREFARHGAKVIGISGGDAKTKEKFCSKYELAVHLVSDSDFAVSKAYGVYGDKKFMGRTYQGIFRTTFVVDSAGKIAAILNDVTPKGHVREVLDLLGVLAAGDTPTENSARKVKRVAGKSPKKSSPSASSRKRV